MARTTVPAGTTGGTKGKAARTFNFSLSGEHKDAIEEILEEYKTVKLRSKHGKDLVAKAVAHLQTLSKIQSSKTVDKTMAKVCDTSPTIMQLLSLMSAA